MLHPPDHAALLARRDFVLPPGDEFTPGERDLLTRYGRWLEALAAGTVSPTTPGQEEFVRSARGGREPETEFEKAWAKVVRARERADGTGRAFDALARARADRAAAEAEYGAARAAVLATVRDQLDAVDAAFADRLAETTAAAVAAEAELRELVLRARRSASAGGVKAVYTAGRVTWDTPGLAAYAEHHPEVLAFRKVGKPFVVLRFADQAGGPGPADPPAERAPSEPNA
ncbi:MAG: hypothetical protein C0501_17065 [Isosphaera sp.]|nr:hypothetical protein [Isosphaera sp.]